MYFYAENHRRIYQNPLKNIFSACVSEQLPYDTELRPGRRGSSLKSKKQILWKAYSLQAVRQTIRVGTRDSFEQKLELICAFSGKKLRPIELKSLIMAQIERWRHALNMQVERESSFGSE